MILQLGHNIGKATASTKGSGRLVERRFRWYSQFHPALPGSPRHSDAIAAGIYFVVHSTISHGMLTLPQANIVGKMEQAFADGIMQRIYYDQDLLNLVFRNNWLQLPWRWNTIGPLLAHESLNPAILHYTGTKKPWGIWVNWRRSIAFARFYRHVMTNEIFYAFARHRRISWWKKTFRAK